MGGPPETRSSRQPQSPRTRPCHRRPSAHRQKSPKSRSPRRSSIRNQSDLPKIVMYVFYHVVKMKALKKGRGHVGLFEIFVCTHLDFVFSTTAGRTRVVDIVLRGLEAATWIKN